MPPDALPPPMLWLAAVVALFVIKHAVADFLLQTGWMAAGKERAKGWLVPLLAHAAVHGAGTAAIAIALAPRLVWLAAVDVGVHFLLDRGKSVLGRAAGIATGSQPFWWLIGIDQALHQITHLGFALLIAAA